eukprot:TRINITY_DN15_c0_g1_i1.p1 TRINITY_DN15_c0_g1~~TRINITY_DN15_c0_g1_i1.p1  ORF type:complete len:463 (-),score=73.38 TRINITY_DN15_c0_g1_i1:209-1597(-)
MKMLTTSCVCLCVLLLLTQVYGNGYIPIYVMLPLNIIQMNNTVCDPNGLYSSLSQLATQGKVDGIMVDVWWGAVEQTPMQYNFSAYSTIFQFCVKLNLKVKATMSFHECGGNVGDDCSISLPNWVKQVGQNNPDIYYTDQSGNRDQEYLSWGVDTQPLFNGRTAVQIYTDFMSAFKSTFSYYLGSTITEIQVGLGPAGEMRYPSYQLAYWTFPGVGEFQCYDKYILADLANAARQAGQPQWGNGGPNNAGNYNSMPSQTAFFSTSGYNNYNTSYGDFFLSWYSQRLIDHGSRILSQASSIFHGFNGLDVTGKVAGIHWQYKDPSHAAELTAGYYNTDGINAYNKIASMFAANGVGLDFTCLEMLDSEQCGYGDSCVVNGFCSCAPQELVGQVELSAQQYNVQFSGENALPRYDNTAYSTIEYESDRYYFINSFSYLRLSSTLLSGSNWSNFQNFVSNMHNLL